MKSASNPGKPPAGAVARRVHRRRGAIGSDADDAIAAEVPVALAYNGEPFAVMMATPGDIDDFALGFSLSEGIVDRADELRIDGIEESVDGIAVAMTIAAARAEALGARRRNLQGRSGCGVCGTASVEAVLRAPPAIASDHSFHVDALARALRGLQTRQPLNAATGATHAAAWADASGEVSLVREDVGRHNALDKLIGAIAKAGIDPRSGFAVVTSRASYEMAMKAGAGRLPVAGGDLCADRARDRAGRQHRPDPGRLPARRRPCRLHASASPAACARREGRRGVSKPPVRRYDKPAGGWGALKSAARHLIAQDAPLRGAKTLLSANQPDGFDCPGCAWPDRDHASTFEFCENGVKAVAAEATATRVTPEFFAQHTVAELARYSDHGLEEQGRLTDPLRLRRRAATATCRSRWDEAFAVIAAHLNALDRPGPRRLLHLGPRQQRGRVPVPAVRARVRHQQFPRLLEHVPRGDRLRACREQIGIGKGTVTLDDFEHADAILIFGQNPGTNHPRMLGELRERGQARRAPSSRSIRCASAGSSASPTRRTRCEMLRRRFDARSRPTTSSRASAATSPRSRASSSTCSKPMTQARRDGARACRRRRLHRRAHRGLRGVRATTCAPSPGTTIEAESGLPARRLQRAADVYVAAPTR